LQTYLPIGGTVLFWTSSGLFVAAAIGFALLVLQLVALSRHMAGTPRTPTKPLPRVSILKPLCGLDDDLAAHLAHFATLDYPDYELLLGVRDTTDTAYPTALDAAARWPGRVRVLVQRGTPGLNPKVNQLITLGEAATGEVLVISDSNARAESGFLREIVACFEDPQVGAALENMHMASIGLGLVAAKRVAGQDLVVGKTMSLRRRDLDTLGGFHAVRDVLAEDHVLGRWVPARLGMKVALARGVVSSVARRHRVSDFIHRYERWSVMQRQAVGELVYVSQLLLNPSMLAVAAAALHPTRTTMPLALAFVSGRIVVDGLTGALLREHTFAWRDLACSPLKDALIAWAWLHGLLNDTVVWRGHRLQVQPGTLLRLPPGTPLTDLALAEPTTSAHSFERAA
jgi:ceramide glucosyltransferase